MTPSLTTCGKHLCAALALVLALVATMANAAAPAANRLIAFVGQKLKVEQFEPPGCKQQTGAANTVCVVMDSAFHAEYRVLKVVHGRYEDATIRFDAFDHYGWPPFANHEHALLFVIRAEDGRLYHQKYQYVPVYETADGDWAACRSTPPGPSTPAPISFKQPVVIPLKQLNPIEIEIWRKSPEWELNGQQAVCRMGVAIEELLEVKKLGALE